MTRNPDDYPRRGRVIGGRSVHALPAKGHYDPRYPRMRRIIANAACRKEFNLTRDRDTVLPPGTPVSCVACCRALGLPSGSPAEGPGTADRSTRDHPVSILRAAATVAEQFADAADLQAEIAQALYVEPDMPSETLERVRRMEAAHRAHAAMTKVAPVLAARDTRIAELEAEIDRALLTAKERT